MSWFGPRVVSAPALRVSTHLLGAPLASPQRRALALAIDLALLILPSVAVAVFASWLSIRASEPRAAEAVLRIVTGRAEGDERQRALRDALPLLARGEARGLPVAARLAIEEGDVDRAAALLRDHHVAVTVAFSGHKEPHLEPGQIRLELQRLVPAKFRALATLGLAGAYFIFFTAGRRGATLGKRLLRIRVARLDGEPVSLFESLERFGGYFHVGGTIGIGLIDLWHDPDRRLAHDRIAGTVVIEDRPPVAPAAAPEPPADAPVGDEAPG
ncbi:MAG: RDD family protein [Vicinamibacteria bacterium]|nr:RDD family protein [Vicinamibacteria bacterium]